MEDDYFMIIAVSKINETIVETTTFHYIYTQQKLIL